MTTTTQELFATELTEEQLARAEALDRACLLLGRADFPHEITGLARFIIYGTDVFNDNENEAVDE